MRKKFDISSCDFSLHLKDSAISVYWRRQIIIIAESYSNENITINMIRNHLGRNVPDHHVFASERLFNCVHVVFNTPEKTSWYFRETNSK